MSSKRRQYSAEFKLDTVMEGIRGEKPVAQICRERNISDSLYYKWRDLFKEHAPEIFNRQAQKDQVVGEQDARIAELERMVGKLVTRGASTDSAHHDIVRVLAASWRCS